jgi:hypothetical protein
MKRMASRAWLATLFTAIVLAAISFLVARSIANDESAVAQPDDPPVSDDITPEPGATPDRTQPGWYVPYLNLDRDRPKFEGEINGVWIGTPPAGWPQGLTCESGELSRIVGQDALERFEDHPYSLEKVRWPDGVSSPQLPIYTVCDDELIKVEVTLSVAANERRGPGVHEGGTVIVTRAVGNRYTGPPAAGWTAGSVAGRSAVLLPPVIDAIGLAGISIVDEETGGLTSLKGHGVFLDTVMAVAEAMYRDE